jgi:hypothetical protein
MYYDIIMVLSSDIISNYIFIKHKYKTVKELHKKCLDFFYRKYGKFIREHQNEINEFYKNHTKHKKDNVQYGSDINDKQTENIIFGSENDNNECNIDDKETKTNVDTYDKETKTNVDTYDTETKTNVDTYDKELDVETSTKNTECNIESESREFSNLGIDNMQLMVLPSAAKSDTNSNNTNIIKSFKKTIKFLYRKITVKTHPDRCKDVKVQKYFLKAKKAYDNKNIVKLFIIGYRLKIKMKYIDQSFLDFIFKNIIKIIDLYQIKIHKILISDEWKWFHTEYKIEPIIPTENLKL